MPQPRLYVPAHYLLVPFPRPLAHCILDIGQPPVKVLAQRHSSGVKGQPAVCIRHSLPKRPLCLGLGFGGNIPAVAVQRKVGATVAYHLAVLVLARVDRARSVPSLLLFRHRPTPSLVSRPPQPPDYLSCLHKGCAVCRPLGSGSTSTALFPLAHRPSCAGRHGPLAARRHFGIRDALERCSVCFRHGGDLWRLGAGPTPARPSRR